ncbi:protein of unknown function [Pseudobacteriovorax antillogorgiicola]|uniref:DUF4272 domain-containing protein n=1 Tax=Pseudobacteriovorax antillogorgiicola TaxID=1513793 RepID=A0A1Y6B8F4_9BACT|nr:uncharacterized protein DUF4272 [Pseudobacteriovorax antillogorgiicola]SME98305.1 protein of unknown function [Pseudobacteriovorax antillogorgiicola]
MNAIWAESIRENSETSLDQLEKSIPLGFIELSAQEKEFLHSSKPNHQEVIDALWKYEGINVFLWVLGLTDSLSLPNKVCSVPELVSMLLDSQDQVMNGTMRSPADILDAIDFNRCLHWHVVEARSKQRPIPDELDEGVIMERSYAFNWLINYWGQDWDNTFVST